MLSAKLRFKNNKSVESLKCTKCDEYWGLRQNGYLCSHCGINVLPNGKKPLDIEEFMKSRKYEVMPDRKFNAMSLILKSMPADADEFHYIIRQFQPRDVTYLLSDEQAQKCAQQLYLGPDMFKISHAITRWRYTPWSKTGGSHYHASSKCYYGNFGETPQSHSMLEIIFDNNLSHNNDV